MGHLTLFDYCLLRVSLVVIFLNLLGLELLPSELLIFAFSVMY